MKGAVEISLPVKVLSVNQCWQGKRFKTPEYKSYEREILLRLRPITPFPDPPFRIEFEFGMSNMQGDYDNPIKPLQDILSKKYGFNDCHIQEAYVKKVKVTKGEEYFRCSISTIE